MHIHVTTSKPKISGDSIHLDRTKDEQSWEQQKQEPQRSLDHHEYSTCSEK